MRNYIFIFLLGIIFLSTKCIDNESEDCHKNINIVNNSRYVLQISVSNTYPDSTSSSGFGERYESFNSSISAHSIGKFQAKLKGCIEDAMKSESYRKGVMMLFFFDKEVIENTSWETIVKDRMYLKKYDLTLEDLQNNNWTITYP
jgi:hypothetical protein